MSSKKAKLMVTVDLPRCARCNGSHSGLVFRKLKRNIENYTHWCLCPITSEPIIMVIKEK